MTARKHVETDLGHVLLDWLVRVMFSTTLLNGLIFFKAILSRISMPVLQEHQPFLVHSALSAPRWHQRAGWATQWRKKKCRDREINNILIGWKMISSLVGRKTFITMNSQECMLRSLKCCSTRFFLQTPMYHVLNSISICPQHWFALGYKEMCDEHGKSPRIIASDETEPLPPT